MLTQEYLLSESSFLFLLQKGVKLPIIVDFRIN